VAADIGKIGTAIAILTFLILVIRKIIDMAMNHQPAHDYFSIDALSFVVDAFMIGVTIIVVAVPEV